MRISLKEKRRVVEYQGAVVTMTRKERDQIAVVSYLKSMYPDISENDMFFTGVNYHGSGPMGEISYVFEMED